MVETSSSETSKQTWESGRYFIYHQPLAQIFRRIDAYLPLTHYQTTKFLNGPN